MKFLRAIRLDESDTRVYAPAATPGELAVTGSFEFLDADPATLQGPRRQAFASGFLGVESLGWTTLVEVTEIGEVEYRRVIERLARHFVDRHGAPGLEAALPAAREEAAYTVEICAHPPATLLAIERELSDEGVVEKLKVIRPSAGGHAGVRLWGPDEED